MVKDLRTENVGFNYKNAKHNAIDQIDFRTRNGRRTALLGENGCGKSTLIYHLNGVYRPSSGTVYYGDDEMSYDRESLNELRSEVCVVLQNPDDQIFSATVEEDVAFGALNAGFSREEVEDRMLRSLERVGMSEFARVPVQQLSYGQKKRVSLAGALALEPKVLILDEPTAGLDPQMTREVMEMTDVLNREGITVMVATHDVNMIYPWVDDLYVMRNGRIVYTGNPEEFFEDRSSVNLSGLEQPSVFGINHNIEVLRGRSPKPYPKTMSQVVSKLFPAGEHTGTIFIYCTEGERIDQGALEEAIGKKGIPTAVYGPSARRAVSNSNLRVDFYFNGIEGCIRESMVYHDSLMILDKELKAPFLKAVEALARFGTKIRTSEVRL